MKPLALILFLSGCGSILTGEATTNLNGWTLSTDCLLPIAGSLFTGKFACGVSAEMEF